MVCGIPIEQLEPMFIIKDYANKGYEDGDDIRDKDVVRPANHKWIVKDNVKILEMSSMRCPTYGTCEQFWKSGPTGKRCAMNVETNTI